MEAATIMNERRVILALALVLVITAVLLRLLPHPANFAPVMAVAIFGGAVLPRKFALWIPVTAMAISDMIIGFYDIMPIVWGCYLVVALVSHLWLRQPNVIKVAVATFSASLFFFVVTNFAVWAADGMYDHTLAGLAQCYTMALPFFRNTFLSDAFYTSALFGIFALSSVVAKRLMLRNQEAVLR